MITPGYNYYRQFVFEIAMKYAKNHLHAEDNDK